MSSTIKMGGDEMRRHEGNMLGPAKEIAAESTMKENYQSPRGWGTRYTVAVMLFFAATVSYSMRMNLSLAIVEMVNRTHASGSNDFQNSTDTASYCPELIEDDPGVELSMWMNGTTKNSGIFPAREKRGGGEFNWNEAEQGWILGTFFWGYIVTQIPGGILAKKYGPKWPLGLGLLLSAIFSLLTPLAARTHVWLLVLARVIQGLGSGLHFAAQATLIAAWSPPQERSTLVAVSFGGMYFGTALTMVVSGHLIHEQVLGGWPSVFYLTGFYAVLWFLAFCFLVYNSPEEHPRISTEECVYIVKSIGQIDKANAKVPWRNVLTSAPMWAIFVAHLAQTWGLYTLLTELPTFMKTVLHFNIRKNSLLSAIPYVTCWIFGIAFAQGADMLLKRKCLSNVNVRKIAQVVAHGGSGLALIGCAYSGCDQVAVVSLLIVSVGLTGATNTGFVANYVEVAPNHVGIILGACNTVANFNGVFAPYLAGLIINENPSLENWRLVFLLSAGVYLFSSFFYLLFASGDEQPWNCSPEELSCQKSKSETEGEEMQAFSTVK